MYRSFQEIENKLLSEGICKKLVLANAHDREALTAVVCAKRKKIIYPILVGLVQEIEELLKTMGEKPEDYEIHPAATEQEAAAMAMQMVAEGAADIPMKGIMQTATFMRALLNKELKLFPEGNLLSETTVLDWEEKGKFLFISDCAINISPDLDAKRKILNNAVQLAHSFGVEKPVAAILSAVEVVKDKIPSTLDAAALAAEAHEDCIVGGPFALDNAVSEEAARHKGIHDPAAGKADVLIVPDLCTGNVFTKSLTFFAHLKSAGAVCGSSVPVVMTSRTDTPENKYYSILTAIMQSL